MEYCIGVDIGGTNIACGVVDKSGAILHKQSIKTESQDGYRAVVTRIAELVDQTLAEYALTLPPVPSGHPPSGRGAAGVPIGVGCPGLCNKDTGVVERSGNLNWDNVPLRDDLARLTGSPVHIDNDANAAAYGEFIAGAAKGTNSAVVITLGTGVGSGIIIDKKLYYGENFAGGEIGHMVIEMDGVDCTCGRKGCFEVYSSATGLIRMTGEALEDSPQMREFLNSDGRISARTAWRAADSGDSVAQRVVERYIRYLACGITNVINIFQPDIICIGGGVCNEGDNLLLPLKQEVAKQVFSRHSAKNTQIAICQLGNDAGIIGAALTVYS